jgi:hypothetical protein
MNAAPALHAGSAYDQTKGGYAIYQSEKTSFRVGGEFLLRHEDWNWFGDVNDAYTFQFLRARMNVKAKWEHFSVFVQPQYVAINDLPDDATLPAPGGPSGMGGLYYVHNREKNPDSLGFHQAWFEFAPLADYQTSIKAGRLTYASGMEHINPGDGMKFNTLKGMRLGDRMISSFEWSAFARSFDGAQIHSTLPGKIELTASWMFPTQGGWEKDFNESMDDVRLAALAITLPKDVYTPGTEWGLFAYNYRDERSCSQRIDNTGITKACGADIDVTVAGLHALGIQKLGDGQLDYLFWGAWQWGDWYELDHRAYAVALEAGYQWTALPLKPWMRIGWFMGSGDDNPADGDHGTFFQMAPGTRKYQLFPYYDLQNIEYAFAQLLLFPRKDLKVRLDYSVNWLAESTDRWYMGTGPTQNEGDIFGYLARPSNGNDALSQEASLMLMYDLNEHLSFNLFYSHVWADDVIDGIYSGSTEADYFSLETTFKF